VHSPAEETLTGAGLLAWRQSLLAHGGQSADLDWLLDLAGGLDWSARQRLWLDPQRPAPLHFARLELEQIWLRHRRDHTPLQYLVGCCPWRDFDVRVGPGVLIPRQETELLVDLAVEAMAPSPLEAPLRWADLGTGSGCLALALATAFPASTGVAVDCSGEALLQAEDNLQLAGLLHRVDLRKGSWWSSLEPLLGTLDLVVSNPPYIPSRLLNGSIPSSVSMSPGLPSMVARMVSLPCGRSSPVLARLWPPGGGCCWSITMTRASRSGACWLLPGLSG